VLVNRVLRGQGKPTVNAKQVLRILQVHGLTLERHTGLRPGRTHDGVVIALRSNVRWCSDHLDLFCRDGSVVRVLFAIDGSSVRCCAATGRSSLGRPRPPVFPARWCAT